jgi:CheY-like chemotaxis protein
MLKMKKILIVEDDETRIEWFLKATFQHMVFICDTAEDAIQRLKSESFDIIFLDHDLCNEHYKYVGVPLDADFEEFCKSNLDATTGFAVARFLADNPDKSPNADIIIHTMNTVAQVRMERELHSRSPLVAGFDYLKKVGFTLH